MKSKIYIDGVETRKEIGKLAGRRDGIDKLCKAAGLPSEPINKACLNGFAYPEVVNKYMKAGIPIVISGTPVPSRVKVRHTRKKATENTETEQKPLQLEFDNFGIQTREITKADIIKDIMIKHLKAMIAEIEAL